MFVEDDGGVLGDVVAKQQLAEAVLNVVLDGSLQRAGTELHIVALGGNKLLGTVGELEVVAQQACALVESLQLDIYNLLDCIEVELIEGDNFIETVEELW